MQTEVELGSAVAVSLLHVAADLWEDDLHWLMLRSGLGPPGVWWTQRVSHLGCGPVCVLAMRPLQMMMWERRRHAHRDGHARGRVGSDGSVRPILAFSQLVVVRRSQALTGARGSLVPDCWYQTRTCGAIVLCNGRTPTLVPNARNVLVRMTRKLQGVA